MADVVDFPEKPGYSKRDLERVQRKLLEMADVVTDILDRNGIRHFITFGTLLGSVRHSGFIHGMTILISCCLMTNMNRRLLR